ERAFAWLALHEDGAVGLLDDAVHRREAEAGPFAGGFGSEERLEDVVAHFGAHSFAGVAHEERRVLAFREPGPAHFAGVDARATGLEGQRAAVGHGVARVDREVQDHLLELSRISDDDAGIRIGVANVRGWPDEAKQQLLRAAN